MEQLDLTENSWRRAWADTERFRHSTKSFWGTEVVGAAIFGAIGVLATPSGDLKIEQAVYPAIGIIFGFVFVFGSVLAWNLFRAPYCQRDEARRLVRLQSEALRIEIRQSSILPEGLSTAVRVILEIALYPRLDMQWSSAVLTLSDGLEIPTISQTPALTAGRNGDYSLEFSTSIRQLSEHRVAGEPDYGRLRLRADARDWYSDYFYLQTGMLRR